MIQEIAHKCQSIIQTNYSVLIFFGATKLSRSRLQQIDQVNDMYVCHRY